MCCSCHEVNKGLLTSSLILVMSLTVGLIYYDKDLFNYFSLHRPNPTCRPNNDMMNTKLIIGITSAPDHIQQRQSLRKTWIQLLPQFYAYKFLIGEQLCDIHPTDRTTQYSCEVLDISIPENTTKNTMFFTSSVQAFSPTKELLRPVTGFTFHVNHPIVVHLLGVGMNVLPVKDETLIRVTLYEQTTSAKIHSVTFNPDSLQKTSENNFKKLNDPILLPRGFEGNVKVDGLVKANCRISTKWTHSNLITINNIDTLSLNASPDSHSTCILPTLGFTIKNVDELKYQLGGKQNRTIEWLRHNEELRKKLQGEMERYRDIIRPNIVDVYRNLPKKVLLFLKWAHTNYKPKYVLKTDDDTFIDIMKVKRELDMKADWAWWSCFRVGWPVQKQGKWLETTLIRGVYPPFPSGAGYVLSKHTLEWLVSRADNLSTAYQGEDVSMGIWLEGLQPTQHVGEACLWACDNKCHSTDSFSPCNKIELSVNEVYDAWATYQMCGNICYCHTNG